MTQRILLTSVGGPVGQLHLPPFQLHESEWICLHVPGPLQSHREERQLVETITGTLPSPGLQVQGRIIHAQQPIGRGGFWQALFPSPYCRDWLARAGGISRSEAAATVARLGLSPSWRISHVAGNTRTFLALEAAWGRQAEVVVFRTGGWCDPRGLMMVHELVCSRLDRCSVVHLSFPDIHGEWHCQPFFPRARCVSLERRTELESPTLSGG